MSVFAVEGWSINAIGELSDRREQLVQSVDAGEDLPAGQVSREALYEEVWSRPMLKVAERYGVSSSYMARVCSGMNVPRPPRGHWAKLEHGKPSLQSPLPKARPGDSLMWIRGDDPGSVSLPLPKPPESHSGIKKPRIARSARHPLVAGMRDIYTKGKVIDSGFLKPSQRRLVDIVVTEQLLDYALDMASSLFLRLEAAGHRVIFSPSDRSYSRASVDERESPGKVAPNRYPSLWSPSRSTVVFVGTVAIGLTFFEMTEQLEARYVDGEYVPVSKLSASPKRPSIILGGWTARVPFATGRLCLQAFSPYPVAEWVNRWRETKVGELRGQLDEIVEQLTESAAQIADLVEEGERQAEIRRLEWEEQWRQMEVRLELERKLKAREAARTELVEAIRGWDDIRRIQSFFLEVEREALTRGDEQREVVLGRLAIARDLIGETDALSSLMKWRGPEER